MESKTFYNESLTEHNVHPYHKHTLEGANMALEGVNPSCGDDIVLLLKVEDDKIVRRISGRRLCGVAGICRYDARSDYRQIQG